jgi:hypothetical protein
MGTFLVLRNALAWIRRKAGLRSKLQRRLADDLEEIAKRCARLNISLMVLRIGAGNLHGK